jgi:hypothetical protein
VERDVEDVVGNNGEGDFGEGREESDGSVNMDDSDQLESPRSSGND